VNTCQCLNVRGVDRLRRHLQGPSRPTGLNRKPNTSIA